MLIINLKSEQKSGNYSLISDRLRSEIDSSLQKKEKVVLFHNRKGFARRVQCKDCKTLLICNTCTHPLMNEARTKETNVFCAKGHTHERLKACAKCKGMNWTFLSAGIDRVQADLGEHKEKSALAEHSLWSDIEKQFTARDIILATQIPLLDVPPKVSLGLVALINADTDFYLPDFSANTRVFNRISRFREFAQSTHTRNTIIQTYSLRHHALYYGARGDAKAFLKQEHSERKKFHYPPFGNLIKLVYQNKDKKMCQEEAQKLHRQLSKFAIRNSKFVKISPPQPTWVPIIRGNYRYQLVIKTNLESRITRQSSEGGNLEKQKSLTSILKSLAPSWLIDVDPISLL